MKPHDIPVPASHSLGPTMEVEGQSQATLQGQMGTWKLTYAVLSWAAPLGSASIVLPLVMSAEGLAAPYTIIATTVLFLFLAIAAGALAKRVPCAGGFYSFITAGLQRPVGLGAAFLGIYAYWLICLGSFAWLGYITAKMVVAFDGPSIDWRFFAFATVLIAGVTGYRNIELSAKVLGVLLTVEVLIIVILNISIVGHNRVTVGGLEEIFRPSNLQSGNMALAVLFTTLAFTGFESAAIFREETRDPDKTIPRAMWISVLALGVFYFITTTLLMLAFPAAGDAVSIASSNPDRILNDSVLTYLGSGAFQVVVALTVTSVLAALISGQNMVSRYVYSLGKDRILPRHAGAVHKRYGSPHVASAATTISLLVGLIPVVILSDSSPGVIYGHIAGMGSYALLFLMFLVGVSSTVYFLARRGEAHSLWSTRVAPIGSCIGFLFVVALATLRYGDLSGLTGKLSVFALVLTYMVFVGGVVMALKVRRKRPDEYLLIGRQR